MLITQIKPFIVNKPEYKFETILFLPEGEGRKGEGGLRTKGYFKHSYKLVDNVWYICDTEGEPVEPAPEELQEKIREYINKVEADATITYLPLISVITVVFNGEKYLEQTIESVINQTYPNVEYIIIDGGSTDGTLDIIKKYEDRIDYWVSEKDGGIYDAMNKGIYVACGNWLNFMNGGDYFFNESVLTELFCKISIPTETTLIFGNWCVYFGRDYYMLKPTHLRKLIKRMAFSHNSSFFKLHALKKIGVYNTKYEIAGDFDLIERLYIKNGKFFYVPITISVIEGDYGISNTKVLRATFERFIASLNNYNREKFNVLFKFIPEFLIAILMVIWRFVAPYSLRKFRKNLSMKRIKLHR